MDPKCDAFVYINVMRACCMLDQFDRTMVLLELAPQRGVERSSFLFSMLLQQCIQQQSLEHAVRVLRVMKRDNERPSQRDLHRLMTALKPSEEQSRELMSLFGREIQQALATAKLMP